MVSTVAALKSDGARLLDIREPVRESPHDADFHAAETEMKVQPTNPSAVPLSRRILEVLIFRDGRKLWKIRLCFHAKSETAEL